MVLPPYDIALDKSAFAHFLLSKHFKLYRNKLQIDKGILTMLFPNSETATNIAPMFVDVKYLPKSISKYISFETIKLIENDLRSKRVKANPRQDYFDESFSQLYSEIQYAHRNYHGYKRYYCDIDTWNLERVDTTAKLHSILTVLQRYWKSKTSNKQLIYEVILKFVEDLEAPYMEGLSSLENVTPEITMPSNSPDSFRHYMKRVIDTGLPKALIHGLTGKTCNNHKLNTFMRDLIILLVTENPVHSSADEIRAVLDDVANDHPELVKNETFHFLGTSTIRNFLTSSECKAHISYAKDDFSEFKRAILGWLKMTPASAPLVRICIDGYVTQVVCQGVDENGKNTVMQLICVIVMDARTKMVLGMAVGETEHSLLILQALKEYFIRSRGCAPREIVMDGHTAFQSKALERFREEMIRCGVKLTFTNKNPNRNPIERAFRHFQDKVLGHTFAFIGASIKSRGKNALPNKQILVTVKSKNYLKSKEEMTKSLYWLFRQVYNQQCLNSFGETPNAQFSSEEWSIQHEFNQHEIARMLLERHKATITGSGIIISDDSTTYIYSDRTPEVAEKANGLLCEVYVDPQDRDIAYLINEDNGTRLLTMELHAEIPSAEFDRTEKDYEFLKHYSKGTRTIIDHFFKTHETKASVVNAILNSGDEYGAIDFRDYTTRAKQKKEFDTQDTSTQLGLTKPAIEPKSLFDSKKSRFNRRGVRRKKDDGFEFTSTL